MKGLAADDVIEPFYRLKGYGRDAPETGNARLTAGAWTGVLLVGSPPPWEEDVDRWR